jgi:hypothetical protein
MGVAKRAAHDAGAQQVHLSTARAGLAGGRRQGGNWTHRGSGTDDSGRHETRG